MASANQRRKVGIGLLGSGVVGEAIQDILFQDLKGQVGAEVELDIRKIYTRNPRRKKWFKKHPGLYHQAEEVIDDPTVEIVIEALGFQRSSQFPVSEIIPARLRARQVGVTSDKAVLARHAKNLGRGQEERPAVALRSLRRRRHPVIRSLARACRRGA